MSATEIIPSFLRANVAGPCVVNPGTGPVEGATERQARANMLQLIADTGLSDVTIRRKSRADYGDGRFCYVARLGERRVEVQMPGLPTEQTRFMGGGQDPYQFPRLYVSDSSWLWLIAINALRNALTEDEEA